MKFLFLLVTIVIQSSSTLVTPKESVSLFESGITIVDVRTPEEFKEGSLPNALNLSVTASTFKDEITKYDKTKPLYIYCHSGRRSARAAAKMKTLGFETIYELKGGYVAWIEAGF